MLKWQKETKLKIKLNYYAINVQATAPDHTTTHFNPNTLLYTTLLSSYSSFFYITLNKRIETIILFWPKISIDFLVAGGIILIIMSFAVVSFVW